jgi:uncharacterized cupin superfamily protein
MDLTGIFYAGTATTERAAMSDFVQGILGLTPEPITGMTADRFPLPDGSVFAVSGPGEMGATDRSLGFGVADIDQAAAELRAAGIETDETITSNERQRYLHFRAPDGELYELVAALDAGRGAGGVTVLAADASTHPLGPDEPAGAEVLEGTPVAAAATLGHLGPVEVGIWEMTPGTVCDVEVEEIFVVLSGRATVTLSDDRRIELAPGSVVRVPAGARTQWTVHETLRKIYLS